jgi:acetyltransferase
MMNANDCISPLLPAAAASVLGYPSEWVEPVLLDGGARLRIRPVLPEDDALERIFIAQGLTQQSRYLRFQVGMSQLPETVLHGFTHIDYDNHFALIAEVCGPDGPVQIGDARFVRDGDDALAAEFGIAVADAWQGRGIGRLLLERLMQAADAHGVQRLYGDVLRGNRGMTELAKAEGFTPQRHPSDATLVRMVRLAAERTETLPAAAKQAVRAV